MTRTDRTTWMALQARRLFEPVDAAWLAAFRVLYGTLLCISMLRFLVYGWVDKLFTAPTFFFKYWGFAWVEPLPSPWLHALFAVLAVCALATAVGFAFRGAAIALTLGLAYVQLLDVSSYLNHYYLATLLVGLLAVSPAGKTFSADEWLERRRRGGTLSNVPSTVPRLWSFVFRFQVALVYTFAGIAKAQSDWLLHGQPLRVWLGTNAELPVVGPLLTIDGVPLLMSWCGFLFDTTIALWLSWRRTRPYAFTIVVAFHLLTRFLFPIGMFPAIMIVAALAFFEPSWPKAAIKLIATTNAGRCAKTRWSWLRHHVGAHHAPTHARTQTLGADQEVFDTWLASKARIPSQLTRAQRLGLLLAASYCTWQLFMPLRFIAYGGNVLWHEQGMRFSWRVMVRAKGGSTTFWASDPTTGQRWRVAASDYLTPMQQSEMSSQPDLILQLAHRIANDFRARGFGAVEVRAESRVSLNGRRSAPLIDPSVDLSTQEDGLSFAQFILPAPEGAPPHTRVVP